MGNAPGKKGGEKEGNIGRGTGEKKGIHRRFIPAPRNRHTEASLFKLSIPEELNQAKEHVKNLLQRRAETVTAGETITPADVLSLYTSETVICGNLGPAQEFFQRANIVDEGQIEIFLRGRDEIQKLFQALEMFRYVADDQFEAYTEGHNAKFVALTPYRVLVSSRFRFSRIAGVIDSLMLVRNPNTNQWTVEHLMFKIDEFKGVDRLTRIALRDCKCFVLDNSLRESTVGQDRGHTIEDKLKIFEATKSVGFKYIIVAAFNGQQRVDDVFLQELHRRNSDDFTNFFAFSEVADECTKGKYVWGPEHIPMGLQKMEQLSVPNVILEIDLNRADVDYNTTRTAEVMEMLTFLLRWHRQKFGEKAMSFVNLRDFPFAILKNTELLLDVVRAMARLEPSLRPNGILFEEPMGIYLPQEMAAWTRRLRELMDTNSWRGRMPEPGTDNERPDGLLLVHVHNNWGLADACQLASLGAGANGIWCSLCEEGSAQGHSCSAVTLANLARMGNQDVSKRYNAQQLAVAARQVTEATTGHEGHSRQPVYGPRAVDCVFDFPGIAGGTAFDFDTDAAGSTNKFDLATFLGIAEPPVRVNELSSPALIIRRLHQLFGDDPQFNDDSANKMKDKMMDDMRNGHKEEYSSALGIAKLFLAATGSAPQVMRERLGRLDTVDPFTESMCTLAKQVFDAVAEEGSESIGYDKWHCIFGQQHFGSPNSAQAYAAFRVFDLDGDGMITWPEIRLLIIWACREYSADITTFDDIVSMIMRHLIMPTITHSGLSGGEHETGESATNASVCWKDALNSHNEEQICQTYCEDAVLHIDLGSAAKWFHDAFHIPGPQFVCHGNKDIQAFWNQFMEKVEQKSGFQLDSPSNVCIKDGGTVIIQSKFSCDPFKGWIHARYMLRDSRGEWKIRADHINLEEVSSSPSGSSVNLRHLAVIEDALGKGRKLSDKEVRDSLFQDANEFKESFNDRKPKKCAAAYANDTIMQADIPAIKEMMASAYGYNDPCVLRSKDDIELFWTRMIKEVNLSNMKAYESPNGAFPISICVLDDTLALVRSKWRMNRVGGHIHSQLMSRTEIDKPWFVDIDYFAVYEFFEDED